MHPLADNSIVTRRTLLDRLKNADDRDAWQEFYDTYRHLILNIAMRLGLNETDAEDVLQETMRQVNQALPEYTYQPDQARFKTWLFSITRNRVIDQFRRAARHPPTVSPLSPDERQTDLLERAPDPAPMFEQIWAEEWEKELQRKALKEIKPLLKARQYQIACELFVNGRSPAETAQRLGLSVANVYLVKHRVAQRLRKPLQRLKEEI